jgi:hypothetical protein
MQADPDPFLRPLVEISRGKQTLAIGSGFLQSKNLYHFAVALFCGNGLR